MTPVRVLGIGSPWGDDRIGWLAAEALRPMVTDAAVEIRVLDRPGATLVAHLGDAEAVLLLDAVQGGGTPGRLHRVAGPAIAACARAPLATHGFGVAEALALAAALGHLPRRLCLLGVEIAASQPAAAPSAPVLAALPALLDAARAQLHAWRQAG
ncbi:MAG: hydrogenase maturation protease [Pseudomonadota bacterium]